MNHRLNYNIMKKVKGYQCDFCKKLSVNQTYIKKHEEVCFKNPKSKSCITCSWFSDEWDEIDQTPNNYCISLKQTLNKLKTNCPHHKL